MITCAYVKDVESRNALHLYRPPCFSSIDLIVKSYVPVGSVMRPYLLGFATRSPDDIATASPVGFETYSSQIRSVPAHLSVTSLPTNPATFSGLFVNCPHTTATKYNVYTITCHNLCIRFITLTVATHILRRAGSDLNYE